MRRVLFWALGFVALVFLVQFVRFHEHWWWWFEIHTGTQNESGPYYGFFSGFGSDLGEISLLTGLFVTARHVNCHQPKCWSVMTHAYEDPQNGMKYRGCRKHHPHLKHLPPKKHWWHNHFPEDHLAEVHTRARSKASRGAS